MSKKTNKSESVEVIESVEMIESIPEPIDIPEPIESVVIPESKPNFESVINAFPESFTPALIDKAFNLNDGGKTVRRHLRKHFAEELNHAKKDKWTFTKTQANIIEYFASRYSFNAEAIQ